MPRKPATPKEPQPKPLLHVKYVPWMAIKVDELKEVTFTGRDEADVKGNLHAGLRRRYPQGYILRWES